MINEFDTIIKNRKTQKVLSNTALPINNNYHYINELLELASFAPFHIKSDQKSHTNDLNSPVPWRCYTLNSENCRKLLQFINKEDIKVGKIAQLLAAADNLVITTFLPDSIEKLDNEEEPFPFLGNIKNMEHVAAASSAIQNILLGATAREIPNYWSSGGKLRSYKIRKLLKIPMNEILLGAIFLFPKNLIDLDVSIKEGANRNEGKNINSWSTNIEL